MTSYIYGADGTRVSTGTITTWGSCDPVANGYVATKDSILGPSGGQLTETGLDVNGNVAWAHTHVWVGGSLIATYDPDGIHFYLNDWTGSRRVQTDYEGVVEQTCTNLPYGNSESCGNTPSEYLFAGLQQEDNPGLEDATYRQYASFMGRWNSPDPYGGSYNWHDPQSLNRYSYVSCNPLRSGDPSGLNGCTFDPSVGAFMGCGFTYVIQGIGHYLDPGSVVFGDMYMISGSGALGLAGAAADAIPLVDVGLDIYITGKEVGLWGGGSSFHGNVTASQSGKSVPNVPSAAASNFGF